MGGVGAPTPLGRTIGRQGEQARRLLVEQGEQLLLEGRIAVGLAREVDEVDRRFACGRSRAAAAAAPGGGEREAAGMAGILTS